MAPRSFAVRLALTIACAKLSFGTAAWGQTNPPGSSNDESPGAAEGDKPKSESVEKTELTAPQLLNYEPPEFPPAALEQGLTAVVRLWLTVETDGSVSRAELAESPVGNGFDEAALAAAPRLKFSPALYQGKPRRVRIGFEYRFEPTEREKEVPLEPERTVGNLSVRLLLSSKEVALPGIVVVLTNAEGKRIESQSDENGTVRWADLPAGDYRVSVEAEGFAPLVSTERVVVGEQADVTLRLAPRSSETEVIVQGERPPREVTRRTLSRREIERIPGTSGDAVRSIQSLPGVARPPGLAGLLIVRGSAPADTETFVDGSNIPLIFHFGGLSSVIPTELVETTDFYPGNFSVRYGRLTGGVVDVKLRSPNTDCYGDYGAPTEERGCYHGLLQADLIDSRVLIQGPVPGTKDWSFALAGRRSYIETWLKPVLENLGSSVTSAPVYYDYQVILDRDRGPDDRLSFRLFGSDDRFESIITSPSANDPGFGGNLRFGTAFYRGQVLYQKALTKEVNLDAMLSMGGQAIDFGLGGNLKFQLDSVPLVMRSELGYRIHPTAKVNVGIDFLGGQFDLFVRAPPPLRPGEASPGPLATRPARETRAEGFFFRPGWYTDVEWQATKRLRLVPGIRIDGASNADGAELNPRANFRYSLFLPEDEIFPGEISTILKGGVGKFGQPPAFQETDEVFGTPGLTYNRATHYSLGVEQGLSEQVVLTVEGFYKDLYDFVSRTPNAEGVYTYGNEGGGQVVGLETLLKYKPDDRFFGWISYTLSESLRRDCATCPDYLFQYDQTHNLIVLGSYRLGGGWEAGARFRIVSGPLQTPTLSPPSLPAVFSGDAGSYVAQSGVPFSERLPLFHQLDVRIDKRFQFRDFRISGYLDVQNVYNNAAAEGFVYNYNFSERAYQMGLPIIPSIGMRGEF